MKIYTSKKIKRLSTVAKISQKLKKEGKKIVLCFGVFDLVHAGHIRYFKSAKSYGDVLVVGVTADVFVDKGPGRPIFHENLRSEFLAAIEMIDYVVVVKSASPTEAIKAIRPDYYVKGSDDKDQKDAHIILKNAGDEERAVKSVGGKLVYTDETVIYSSSKIIGDYLDVYPPKTKKYLDAFKRKYSAEYIIKQLTSLGDTKVLIIGDTIIDQYHYCLPLGKSSKEPVMVHQFISDESFAGGVLATANHTASLSGNITLVTVLGKKRTFKSFILKKLRPSVKPIFFYQSRDSTIVKRRFVDVHSGQKLFQVSFLRDDFVLPEKPEREIIQFLTTQLPGYDMVIVNDFGHGMLTKKMIKVLCKKAKFLALNVQANSANFGFNVITKYPRADYICIDNQEIRLATHDKYSDLAPLIKKIYRRMRCSFMIVTRGPKGAVGYSQKTGFLEAPALSDRIVDRVGAGDALFAITSPCVYGGLPADLVTFMGNVAGALKVQVVGNRKQIEFADLVKFTTRLLK